jgi:hypothetical protein
MCMAICMGMHGTDLPRLLACWSNRFHVTCLQLVCFKRSAESTATKLGPSVRQFRPAASTSFLSGWWRTSSDCSTLVQNDPDEHRINRRGSCRLSVGPVCQKSLVTLKVPCRLIYAINAGSSTPVATIIITHLRRSYHHYLSYSASWRAAQR